MEIAFVSFVTQWKSYLTGCQIRNQAPSLDELLAEYDYLVAYVDSMHPGFSLHLANLAIGSFSSVVVNVPRVIDIDQDQPMEVIEAQLVQAAGESTMEVQIDAAEIIDLTLD